MAETEAPGTTVSVVARRHNLHSSLLFRWRRDALGSARVREAPPPPAFAPLTGPVDPPSPAQPIGTIEVELMVLAITLIGRSVVVSNRAAMRSRTRGTKSIGA